MQRTVACGGNAAMIQRILGTFVNGINGGGAKSRLISVPEWPFGGGVNNPANCRLLHVPRYGNSRFSRRFGVDCSSLCSVGAQRSRRPVQCQSVALFFLGRRLTVAQDGMDDDEREALWASRFCFFLSRAKFSRP
mgnify:FL=1